MTHTTPAVARQAGGSADFKALQARMSGEVADGAYSSTAFMNYLKPVAGARKFDAQSLATSTARVG